jgi:hypothetical protein
MWDRKSCGEVELVELQLCDDARNVVIYNSRSTYNIRVFSRVKAQHTHLEPSTELQVEH